MKGLMSGLSEGSANGLHVELKRFTLAHREAAVNTAKTVYCRTKILTAAACWREPAEEYPITLV
jgi:hypothetical protein